MKTKCKVLSLVLATVMCFGLVSFAGCSNTTAEAKSTMTVDINPSVEFTLDKDNKIITATALNDDGAVLIQGKAFAGKTADEGAKLVVELATDQGYLVKGEIEGTPNTVNISVSGNKEAAEKIYQSAKEKVNKFIADKGIDAKVADFKQRTTEELRKICVKMGLDEKEAAKMTDEELVKYLGEVREETKNLMSEELREMYYKAKNYEIKVAESDAVLNAMDDATNKIVTGLKLAKEALQGSQANMIDAYNKAFVSADSGYQKAVKALLDAKVKVNEARKEVAKAQEEVDKISDESAKKAAQAVLDTKLAAYDAAIKALEGAESGLETAKKAAQATFDLANQTFETLDKGLDGAIELVQVTFKTKYEAAAKDIDKAANTAKDKAFDKFEKSYKSQIAAYNDMVKNAQKEMNK